MAISKALQAKLIASAIIILIIVIVIVGLACTGVFDGKLPL